MKNFSLSFLLFVFLVTITTGGVQEIFLSTSYLGIIYIFKTLWKYKQSRIETRNGDKKEYKSQDLHLDKLLPLGTNEEENNTEKNQRVLQKRVLLYLTCRNTHHNLTNIQGTDGDGR